MATKQLSLHCKTWAVLSLATGAVLMTSCAQDDLTGEKFDSGVNNAQLEAPRPMISSSRQAQTELHSQSHGPWSTEREATMPS